MHNKRRDKKISKSFKKRIIQKAKEIQKESKKSKNQREEETNGPVDIKIQGMMISIQNQSDKTFWKEILNGTKSKR